MIANYKEFHKFEKELISKEKVDIKRNFRIIDALYHEAVKLGIIPIRNPLDGLETDIKIAHIINSVSRTHQKNSPKTE